MPSNTRHFSRRSPRCRIWLMSFGAMQPLKNRLRSLSKRLDKVRNRFFKGCIAPKDITHIRQHGEPRNVCYLFEGFMDYLSFLTIRVKNNPQYPRLTTQDYIILNSVSNLAKVESLLANYTQFGSYLDNDTAGRNACETLKAKFGERLLDKSLYYREYKDLNDYLCGKTLFQSAEPIKQEKRVQSARRMIQPPKKRGMKM